MKNIVSIHGAPRSGTSWLGQLIDSSENVKYKFQPLFSYMFKDYINLKSDKNDWMSFFHHLYNTQDIFLDQLDKKETFKYPQFDNKYRYPDYLVMKMVRYHYLIPRMLELFPEMKIIGLVRNPCSVMNSWRKAPREFLKGWDFNSEWYFGQSKNDFRPEEYYGFNKWKELSGLFLSMQEKYPDNFYLIQYEHLVEDTDKLVSKLFNFINLDVNDQTDNFIKESKSKHVDDVYSVFKGNKDIDEWKNELPKQVINQIYKELEKTPLERFLI